MRFRNRNTDELRTEPPPPVRGWGPRLAAVGQALDAREETLRDLAIAVAGPHAVVSVLSWQAGYYRGAWMAVDFVVALPDHLPGPIGAERGSWSHRLFRLGEQIQATDPAIRDPLVLGVDGGWVVTATTAAGGQASWEVAEG